VVPFLEGNQTPRCRGEAGWAVVGDTEGGHEQSQLVAVAFTGCEARSLIPITCSELVRGLEEFSGLMNCEQL